ncbi:TonB-dependent receptor plug domain-containing protein [Hymenobacter taeanensis]|uniref:TonB-dependent receptor plug domain-containing protein n=1 Tax=Hymenobacter taeanensis TaxID=2735321 RepID=A0A6M6BEG2_9BACT|nr:MULTISPECIES: TonB-dependent receptor plug domain-containing protein [Hymenobacter]QJX46332.1 TonB-dependent receptor plug domain-containing protein [Hymenobacter taeanensis]UOQ80191.1 TonB-dependent receptor plug domain-containing protein [Hymenobacter sp. 5414T-23]
MKLFRLRRPGLAVVTLALLGAGSAAFQAPDNTPATYILTRLQAFYNEAPPEVSYLHTNQVAYAAGETLWFKAYVLNGQSHQLDSMSRVLYVDMVAPNRQVAFRRTLSLRGGLAEGDIVLPDTLAQGVYTLRAYTSWMRNQGEELFFSRRVPVWQASVGASEVGSVGARAATVAATARRNARLLEASRKPDVQFFPEGGEYVAGLQTVLAVKATTASGQGLAVSGHILDEQDQQVAAFSTPALGMSSLGFTPAAGRRYHARVTLPDGTTATYPLPAVQPAGWLLNVREIGGNYQVYIRHQVAAGAAPAPETLRLVAHVRGMPVFVGEGKIAGAETYQASIPKAKLPAGLLHITVFDGQQVARAERLVFVPEEQGLQVTLTPHKPTYRPREAVTMQVEVRTPTGEPAPAELSMAVVSTAGLPATGTTDATMQSHLLLTSELRGYVENPGYYFRNPNATTRRALDDLLLTQGWSRFVWKELLTNTPPNAEYVFPAEQALSLGGQLIRPNQKPVPNGSLTLLQKDAKALTVGNANAEGYFLFLGLPAQDTTKVLLQARTDKGKSNVLIKLNELWPAPTKLLPVPLLPTSTSPPPEIVAYGQRSRRQQVLEKQFRPDSTSGIVLRNVTIQGQRQLPAHDPRSLHGQASNVLDLSKIPNANTYTNIFDLLQGRVPGVTVTRSGYSYQVLIRGISSLSGSSQPLFLLDGMPMLDADGLLGIMPNDVERIEVLKGAAAAIYGSQGGNGVIAVFTKRGGSADASRSPAAGILVRTLPAFYRARQFYAPHYAGASSPKPDPRTTTLYWLPRLQVPASGNAQVTFYASDQGGTFRAAVEGVSGGGQPVVAETSLAVLDQK